MEGPYVTGGVTSKGSVSHKISSQTQLPSASRFLRNLSRTHALVLPSTALIKGKIHGPALL